MVHVKIRSQYMSEYSIRTERGIWSGTVLPNIQGPVVQNYWCRKWTYR